MKKVFYKSRVVSWKPDKGYGFIANPNGSGDLFLHINDIQEKQEPVAGDLVRFQTKPDANGKTVVYNASLHRFNALSTLHWGQTLSVALLPYLMSLLVLKKTPLPLLLYCLMGTICFLMSRDDNILAANGKWRIPDDPMYLAELLWGWPGTLFAQKLYHHKAHKKPFQGVLNFIIFIHYLFWLDYLALEHLYLDSIIKILEYFTTL
jgi:uncharacterized membrane protein YsdA (DUF1294 family)/cold shock CspA family protein